MTPRDVVEDLVEGWAKDGPVNAGVAAATHLEAELRGMVARCRGCQGKGSVGRLPRGGVLRWIPCPECSGARKALAAYRREG